MDTAVLLFYNLLVIPFFWIALQIVALWNEKIRRGLRGRRLLFSSLHAKLAMRGSRPTFWVHVASMGEFEQAKPILEGIKRSNPETFVLVSFFSPSGFDHSQDYSHADAVVYLPFDSFGAARRFVSVVRPTKVLFVRYELWLNHLFAIRRAGIPSYLACTSSRTILRARGVVRWYLTAAYRTFSSVFCIDEHDRAAFTDILGDEHTCLVTGDTRYDRVLQRADRCKEHPLIPESILAGKTVFVAGSTWETDEAILFPAMHHALASHGERFLTILAPHEPSDGTLSRIEQQFSCCRLSRIEGYKGESVILVDGIGKLFSLYQHAALAYVGGGFGDGVHSVLEPAAFAVPVLFGTRIERAAEAQQLLNAGGAVTASTAEHLVEAIDEALLAPDRAAQQGQRALHFVQAHSGASQRILNMLMDDTSFN